MNPNVERLLKAVMASQNLTRADAAKWLETQVPIAMDQAHELDALQHQAKLNALAAGRADNALKDEISSQ